MTMAPELPPDARVDLSPFRLSDGKKRAQLTWEERAALIHEHLPSTHELDWHQAFDNDIDLFAKVMRDILRIDPTLPSRPGPRPPLELSDAASQLQRMAGEDHTLLPFPEAFSVLAKGMALTPLARKTGIARSRVHRLLKGDEPPSAEMMDKIAVAFRKHPSYFVEWRRAYIMRAVGERLKFSPETTIAIYRRLMGRS